MKSMDQGQDSWTLHKGSIMFHLLQGNVWECICEATELHVVPFSKDHTNRTKFSLKLNYRFITTRGKMYPFILRSHLQCHLKAVKRN